MTTAPPVQGSMNLLTRLSRLVYLREQGGSSQQQLGQSLMLDPNNCVILLNDLEDFGYVERRRDPSDRRRHIVEMTDAGRRALEYAGEKLETLEDEVLPNLDASERAQLRDLVAKALEAAPEDEI